jgi:predicted Rossmann fold nucleotide-binding protein DprA/Smf involved in DNA uptake
VSATTLTELQAKTHAALTDRPEPTERIAKRAGLPYAQVLACLMSLRNKGLARKQLNPSRWSRA